MIDLRSDTLTQPTPAMREAIANAAVGDEQKREDPTVNELERRGAEFLGQEEAVFLPTATMANQIALNILGNPGDALLVERHAHIMLSELGGPAAHSGLLTIGLPGTNGRFSPDQVVSELRDRPSVHGAPTRLVAVENTHNTSGGRALRARPPRRSDRRRPRPGAASRRRSWRRRPRRRPRPGRDEFRPDRRGRRPRWGDRADKGARRVGFDHRSSDRRPRRDPPRYLGRGRRRRGRGDPRRTRCYSYWSASRTLSRAARRAGKIAAMIPTTIAARANTRSCPIGAERMM